MSIVTPPLVALASTPPDSDVPRTSPLVVWATTLPVIAVTLTRPLVLETLTNAFFGART